MQPISLNLACLGFIVLFVGRGERKYFPPIYELWDLLNNDSLGSRDYNWDYYLPTKPVPRCPRSDIGERRKAILFGRTLNWS